MRIKQIDGLRFWACMVILADHCRVLGLRYQGGIMVSLFFVLSGFFIANFGFIKLDVKLCAANCVNKMCKFYEQWWQIVRC